MTEPIFQLENLTFAYKNAKFPLFKDFSLSLNKGESLSVIGRSGCGKSTLLKLIFGILQAQSGCVRLNAKNPVYLSQEEVLISSRSVYKNLLLPLRLQGKNLCENTQNSAKEILDAVGLAEYADRPVCELSGGMRKRLELARALLQKPDLLLMDEPFSSLDLFTRRQMISLCRTLQQQHHFALLFVTHYPEEAALLSDQVIVLADQPVQIVYQACFSQKEHCKASEDPFLLPKEDQNILSRVYTELAEQKNKEIPKNLSASVKKTSFITEEIIPACITAVGLFIVISLSKLLFQWPDYLIPCPKEVASVFFSTIITGSIFPDLFSTMLVSFLGFFTALAISIPLSYAMARSKRIQNIFLPPMIILNTLPVIALAPFFLLWFGPGMAAKVLITLLIIFFPLLLSSRSAFYEACRKTSTHRRNFSANRIKAFVYLEWPSALNTLFSAWRTALNGSIVGAVVSEFIIGSVGLGALINISKSTFDTTMMFAALIWLALLGLFYHLLIKFQEKLWVK